MKKIQKQIIFEVLVNLLFFVLFLSFFRYVLFQPGDDQIFIDLRQRFTLGNFLLTYYNTWSGRVINNFLIYIFARHPIVLWQLFMALILTFFGRTIYFYFLNLLDNKVRKKIALIILSYLGVFLFSSAVLIPSVFWFTGSLNYIVSTFFALLAFIPFFRLRQIYETKNLEYWPLFIIPVACTAFACEQVSIGLILITSGSLLLAKIRHHKIPTYLFFLYLLLITLTIVSMSAPGNWLRLQQETQMWFSEHGNMNLLEKITLAFGFALTTIVNQWYYLMGLIWSTTAILVLSYSKKWFFRLLAFILFLYAVIAGLRFVTSLTIFAQSNIFHLSDSLFSFFYLLGPEQVSPTAILVYFFWSIGLLLLPITWLLIMRQKQSGLTLCFLYLVSFFLIMAVGFSPTLFASGGRTGFVPNMLLLFILIQLLWINKSSLILIAPTISLILFKMLTLLYRWNSNGFFVDYGLITMRNIFQH